MTEASGLLLKSFQDLFQHPQPPVELLQLVKDFAKICRAHPQGLLPHEVATVLYYLSIAAGIVRLQQRISTLPDERLQRGFDWAMAQGWVDAPARELLTQAKKNLRSPLKSA